MGKAFESIKRGLLQAIEHANGTADPSTYRVHVVCPIDVEKIRTNLGLTQQEFAEKFSLSIRSIRSWESGKRSPNGIARAYLSVIMRAPQVVQESLTGRSSKRTRTTAAPKK